MAACLVDVSIRLHERQIQSKLAFSEWQLLADFCLSRLTTTNILRSFDTGPLSRGQIIPKGVEIKPFGKMG